MSGNIRNENREWQKWRHITKLDPDKKNAPDIIKRVGDSGTDAVMISGTQRVTKNNVERLFELVKDFCIPIISEPSNKEAANFECDYLFIPVVLNSTERWWIIEAHVDWLETLREENRRLQWDRIIPEAYIVLNPASAVARVTKANTNLNENQVISYAEFADRFLKFPIIYIEYSGTYGDPALVMKVKKSLRNSTLFYGGGIDSKKRAGEMGRYATIIVGNIVYQDFDNYIQTIIK